MLAPFSACIKCITLNDFYFKLVFNSWYILVIILYYILFCYAREYFGNNVLKVYRKVIIQSLSLFFLFFFLKTRDTLCWRSCCCCQQWHLWCRSGIQCQDRRWVGVFKHTFIVFFITYSLLSAHTLPFLIFELQNTSVKHPISFAFRLALSLSIKLYDNSSSSPYREHFRRGTPLVMASWAQVGQLSQAPAQVPLRQRFGR